MVSQEKTLCSKEWRTAALPSQERTMTIHTRSTRVKAPENTGFQNRTLLSISQSYDVSTPNSPGRVDIDTLSDMKSPKLLSTRSEMHITTFNACTLNKSFYLDELTNSMEKHNLSIVCIQEHRFFHIEPIKYHQLSSEYTLLTLSATLNDSNASVGGVGILLNKDSLDSLLSAESITPRILILTFAGNPKTSIICCYSPHNQSSEEEVSSFYQDLSEVMEQVPAHNVVFLCGDFNAQLGIDNVHHSYHTHTNRNGEHLVNFMESFSLVAVNTRFQKPSRKLWTCQYRNGSRGQVDYILVRRKWVKSVTNIETYTSTFSGINSDHKALTAKVKLRLRAPKRTQSDFRLINFRSLTSSKELQNQYAVEVHNRFSELVHELPEQSSTQEKYDCLGKACSEVGKRVLPKKPSKKWSKLHLSPDVVKARDNLLKALSSNKSNTISAAREDLLASYKTAEEGFIDTQVKIIENASFSQKHALAWRVLNEVTGRKSDSEPVRLEGSLEERKKKWKDYFANLLGQPPKVPEGPFEISSVSPHSLPIDEGPFTLQELKRVINSTKRGGAVGVDSIPLELWESSEFLPYLLELCNSGLLDHIKPAQWSKSAIKPIPKKANASLAQHRGISLNTIAAKLYNKMLLNRIQPHIDPLLSWTQAGFRKNRSTLSNILALRRIIEGLKDKNLPLAVIFIDFSKAFDSIHRERMFEILKAYGIPPSIVNAIKLIYENSSAQVLTPDGETSFFDILSGIFQGDTLAPFLFIIVLDYALKQAFKISNSACGIVIEPRKSSRHPEVRIADLAYADDIALLNSSIQLAENLLHSVEQSAAQVGLYLNVPKTKILTNNINSEYNINSLSGEVISEVRDFKYLGAYIPNCIYDFNVRKALAWSATNKLGRIWKSSINRDLKVKFFRACVESILLYNSETWTITKAMENKIDGLYTKLLRRVLNVSWRDHVSNKELYANLPLLSSTIRQRRLRFAGHCSRAINQPVTDLLFWTPSVGKRGRGAGIKTFPKSLVEDTALSSNQEIQDLMADRQLWRQRVNTALDPSTDD